MRFTTYHDSYREKNDNRGKHNIPSSDGDEGDRGYGIVMFAAKPTIPYPPAGGRWNIGFAF